MNANSWTAWLNVQLLNETFKEMSALYKNIDNVFMPPCNKCPESNTGV